MNPEYISITECSALTQVPERTLRYYLAKGRIQGKKRGRDWFVVLSHLRLRDY